ncbi:MAG: hypothetical protein EHM35_21470 [Planctomycetaceae bacterium]|nr:MAG: hypothetical protein EHM35_21470 [Planctomycetaceae bacterium]
MTYGDYWRVLHADFGRLYAAMPRPGVWAFLRTAHAIRFRYVFWFRTVGFTHSRPLLRYLVYPVVRLIHRHWCFHYGIEIPWNTQIGPGLLIGHVGGIVVSCLAKIG